MFEEQNAIFKFYIIKMVKLSQGFGFIAFVIENNRIHCQAYYLTIRYCSLGRELYVVNFAALNSNYKWVF